MKLSIRWKLTLWYGLVLAGVLAVFGATIYFTLRHHLLARIDQGLAEELADVLSEIERARVEAGLSEWLERRFAQHEGFDFQITKPAGEVFFRNPRLAVALPIPADELSVPHYRDFAEDGVGRWRVVAVRATGPSQELTVQVARSLAAFDQETRELWLLFLWSAPLGILIAIGGGYFLAGRALAPVQEITRIANEIGADRLDQRIEVANAGDEIGALAQTLNQMIERLEQSFAHMQRFTADAAHELRTPLAILRTEAEVALRSPRSPEEYVRVLGNLLDETNRLGQVADQLLFLSRQDAGLLPSAREEVMAETLLEGVVEHMRVLAQAKGVSLRLDSNEPCRLLSDGGLLRRVLFNLLDNAIKYTKPGGAVAVQGLAGEDQWTVVIRDSGVGIAAEHLSHVFERFYRADAARETNSGVGLGLALCKSIIQNLKGTIELRSVVGQGTTVRLAVPC
jgi:heavy metal sensor kinase